MHIQWHQSIAIWYMVNCLRQHNDTKSTIKQTYSRSIVFEIQWQKSIMSHRYLHLHLHFHLHRYTENNFWFYVNFEKLIVRRVLPTAWCVAELQRQTIDWNNWMSFYPSLTISVELNKRSAIHWETEEKWKQTYKIFVTEFTVKLLGYSIFLGWPISF
jgi:hypothetical protein